MGQTSLECILPKVVYPPDILQDVQYSTTPYTITQPLCAQRPDSGPGGPDRRGGGGGGVGGSYMIWNLGLQGELATQLLPPFWLHFWALPLQDWINSPARPQRGFLKEFGPASRLRKKNMPRPMASPGLRNNKHAASPGPAGLRNKKTCRVDSGQPCLPGDAACFYLDEKHASYEACYLDFRKNMPA